MTRMQKALGIGSLVLALTACCPKEGAELHGDEETSLFPDILAGLYDVGIWFQGPIIGKWQEPERIYTDTFQISLHGVPRTVRAGEWIDDEDFIIVFQVKSGLFDGELREVYVSKTLYWWLDRGDMFDTLVYPHENEDWDEEL